MGLVAVNEIIQYCTKSDKDFCGLGRWIWKPLEENPQHRIRVLSVYHVGKAKPRGPKTYYQQHTRHSQTHGLDATPYYLFCTDLLVQLCTWQEQGGRVIITMDANEHVLTGVFTSKLQELVLLEMYITQEEEG